MAAMVGNEGLIYRWASFALSTLRATRSHIGTSGIGWMTIVLPTIVTIVRATRFIVASLDQV